ncbi:phage minor head protein [Ancylobacter sp. G4_0304]|uniref:phage head morphogenesis protein n=1 Tax=Ancylobacter sp. G4_0304 TaxID=3114289 RepID=UPI0039C5FBC6
MRGISAAARSFFAHLVSLAGKVADAFPTPPEVLDYFRDKKLQPRFSWLDVWGEEHAHGFTVAGVLEERVLAEFKAAHDKALTGGTGFDKFKADMENRLKPLGWWGARDVVDPETGKVKTVDFTRPRRLEVTFWSNIRAARAAGQWDRIQRTKRALPYLLYVRTTANDPRLEHLAWAGIILPVDHPFWRTHFPPNGWMCKCAVRQISAAQAERLLGRSPEDGGVIYRDTPPEERLKTFINKRTGVRTQVPEGIDPGWHTNPGVGRSHTLGRILADQLDDTSADRARPRIQRLIESEGFRSGLWRAQRLGAERLALEKAGLTRAQIDVELPWQHAPMPVASLTPDLAKDLGVARSTVTATDAALGHAPAHHYPDWIWSRVQEMIDTGEIWRGADGRVIVLEELDGRLFFIVLRPVPGGRLGISTMFQHSKGRQSGYVTKELRGLTRVR